MVWVFRRREHKGVGIKNQFICVFRIQWKIYDGAFCGKINGFQKSSTSDVQLGYKYASPSWHMSTLSIYIKARTRSVATLNVELFIVKYVIGNYLYNSMNYTICAPSKIISNFVVCWYVASAVMKFVTHFRGVFSTQLSIYGGASLRKLFAANSV